MKSGQSSLKYIRYGLFTGVAPVTIVRLKFSMQFRSVQTSELFFNFRDGEDFFELLGII